MWQGSFSGSSHVFLTGGPHQPSGGGIYNLGCRYWPLQSISHPIVPFGACGSLTTLHLPRWSLYLIRLKNSACRSFDHLMRNYKTPRHDASYSSEPPLPDRRHRPTGHPTYTHKHTHSPVFIHLIGSCSVDDMHSDKTKTAAEQTR